MQLNARLCILLASQTTLFLLSYSQIALYMSISLLVFDEARQQRGFLLFQIVDRWIKIVQFLQVAWHNSQLNVSSF